MVEDRIIELTMTSNYLDWTLAESLRDLIQNGIDADKKGFPLTINYIPEHRLLLIINLGAKLPLRSLLIGYTTKKNDADQIGQYGEGLKLSCQSLLRLGYGISIQTEQERWTPFFEHSEVFDAEILKFRISPLPCSEDCIGIRVTNISPEEWEQARQYFLVTSESKSTPLAEVDGVGEVYDDPQNISKIYVGGILIEEITDAPLKYGYNFKPKTIEIDRDRRMVSRSYLYHWTGKVWAALADTDDFFSDFESMVKTSASDTSALQYSFLLSESVRKRLVTSFIEEHGPKAYPCNESYDRVLVGNSGGVVVNTSKQYAGLIQAELGDVKSFCSKLNASCGEEIDPLIMDFLPLAVLSKAKEVLKQALNLSQLPDIRVFDFRDPDILGLYYHDKDQIKVSIKSLTTVEDCLEVLIHEFAHRHGHHESAAFLRDLEYSWKRVFKFLWDKSRA